jgi:hypothetical protein
MQKEPQRRQIFVVLFFTNARKHNYPMVCLIFLYYFAAYIVFKVVGNTGILLYSVSLPPLDTDTLKQQYLKCALWMIFNISH